MIKRKVALRVTGTAFAELLYESLDGRFLALLTEIKPGSAPGRVFFSHF